MSELMELGILRAPCPGVGDVLAIRQLHAAAAVAADTIEALRAEAAGAGREESSDSPAEDRDITSVPLPISEDAPFWKSLTRDEFLLLIRHLHTKAQGQYDGTSVIDYDAVEYATTMVEVVMGAWHLCGYSLSETEKQDLLPLSFDAEAFDSRRQAEQQWMKAAAEAKEYAEVEARVARAFVQGMVRQVDDRQFIPFDAKLGDWTLMVRIPEKHITRSCLERYLQRGRSALQLTNFDRPLEIIEEGGHLAIRAPWVAVKGFFDWVMDLALSAGSRVSAENAAGNRFFRCDVASVDLTDLVLSYQRLRECNDLPISYDKVKRADIVRFRSLIHCDKPCWLSDDNLPSHASGDLEALSDALRAIPTVHVWGYGSDRSSLFSIKEPWLQFSAEPSVGDAITREIYAYLENKDPTSLVRINVKRTPAQSDVFGWDAHPTYRIDIAEWSSCPKRERRSGISHTLAVLTAGFQKWGEAIPVGPAEQEPDDAEAWEVALSDHVASEDI